MAFMRRIFMCGSFFFHFRRIAFAAKYLRFFHFYLHISEKSCTFAAAKVNGNERYSLDSCLVGKLDA